MIDAVSWAHRDLIEITAVHLVEDPSFGHYDVDRVDGLMRSGERVLVDVPFDVLPKRGTVREIVRWARRDRVYFSNLTRHAPHAVLMRRVKARGEQVATSQNEGS